MSASLELISDNIPDSLLSVEEKSKIQSNLMRVLFLAAGNGESHALKYILHCSVVSKKMSVNKT